jgi:hemolysin activation/secretion protein
VRAFQDFLMGRLVDRGHITSRVLIPRQNLAAGRLVVQVIAGRVGAIRDQGEPPGLTALVMPIREGDVLDQRDLDQALENIRRLATQYNVEFDLVPGAEPGETDIVIKHPDEKKWRALLTLDDAGTDSTGKFQLGGIVTLDSPLRLYDALTVTLNRNANFSNQTLGSSSASISWSVPFGYWSLLVGANRSSYKQTVAGFSGDIVYRGNSHGFEAGIGYVPYRVSAAKGMFQFKLNRKVSRSHIDDAEIDVQYRNVTGYDVSFAHRHYLGNSTVDLNLGLKGSLPSHSQAPGLIVGAPDWNGRYQIRTALASISYPFRIGGQQFRYQGSVRIQRAATLLPAFEYFSIGNRYSVRGFDGESTLAAEDGTLLRNDFVWLVGRSGHELFMALDTARLGGPHVATLLGDALTGVAFGARGRFNRFTYEFTLGHPLKKPQRFNAKPVAVTLALAAEF